MTGQAGKVARGLRTIGANIVQLAQKSKEFEITVGGATKTIQLWNEAGTDMLDTYDVLKQISEAWGDMTNAEKSSLAVGLAKKTQMDTFLAVMGNFEDAEKAYTTALLSEGSAWKENEAYMESIEAHQAQLKQQWEQLVLSAPFEKLEKSLLDTGTAILKFANSDLGHTIIKVTAFITTLGLASKAITVFQTLLNSGNAFSIFIHMLEAAIAGTGSLTGAIGYLTTVMLANPLFWGAAAAVVGITAVVKLIDVLTTSFEEATEALQKTNQAIEEQDSTVQSLERSLENIEARLKEINQLKLDITDENELKSLQQESKELERQEALTKAQLALEEKKLEVLRQQALEEANQVRNKSQAYNVYDVDKNLNQEGQMTVKTGRVAEALTAQSKNIDEFKNKISELEKELDTLREAGKETSAEAQEYAVQIQDLNGLLIEQENAAYDNAKALLSIKKANGELTESEEAALNSYLETGNAIEESTDKIKNASKTTEEEINDLVEQWGEAENLAKSTAEAFEQAVMPLSDIENNYSLLNKAVEEFNEKGGLTANTVKKLSQLDAEWLNLLQLENGQLTINTEALELLAEANKEEAIATLQAQAAQDMMNIAAGNFADVSPIAQQAIAELKSKTEEEGQAAAETAKKELLLAAAIKARKYAAEEGGHGDSTQEIFDMIDAVNSAYSKAIDQMNKWSLDTSSANKSASKSGKKAAKDHKDAWLEAFKEEKAALKNLLETDQITAYEYYQRLQELNEKYFGEASGKHEKYIKEYRENEEEIYKGVKEVYDKVRDYLAKAVEQGYEKAINALKKEEKEVLKEIKKQVDALKKEKDNALKGIKKEIDALKKQKETVQDYYNKQIDKIKEENEVLQEQNELLEYQQKLQQAKAQRVMVMENGKFTLSENESAVAEAEQALADYENKISYEQSIEEIENLRDTQVEALEDQIAALEEYYDYMEEWYDSRIEQMEEYYDQVEENYEKQIEALQEKLDAFKEGMQKEEDLENARLAAQVLGMNERKDLYEEELENLKNYINEVNSMLEHLGEAGATVDFSYEPITGYHTGIAEVAAVDASIPSRASGDSYFKEDSVALVGESPNTELLLGSKINTIGGGKLMHLQKGTGVVNAESTSTLAGLLNGLKTPQSNVNNRTTQQNFNFGNISLPNVTNSESFVNTLSKQFNNYAIQYGNIRK